MRKYLAEFVASFMVIFLAAGAVVADEFLTHTRLTDSFGPLGIVAAYAVALAIAMAVVMPISGGHVNPAISIAAFVSRRLNALDTAGYVVAQVAGAILAAFLLRGITPKDVFTFVSGGVPGLGQGISVWQGAALETALTFFVAMAFWAVAVDTRVPRVLAPAIVGGAVFVGGLTGSAFTGAAMNPIRWIGPALAGTHGANWPVWIGGPIMGALLGSLAYEVIFLSESPAVTEEEEGEEEGEAEPAVWAAASLPPAPAAEPPLPPPDPTA